VGTAATNLKKKICSDNKDGHPFINILWKAPFTSGTTSVSNRFRSSGSRSWPTKKLFSIAFASVHPTIIKTFHYYYDHIIEINWFSIYIFTHCFYKSSPKIEPSGGYQSSLVIFFYQVWLPQTRAQDSRDQWVAILKDVEGLSHKNDPRMRLFAQNITLSV